MSAAPSPLATPLPWDLVADNYAAETAPFFAEFARVALEMARLERGERSVDVAAGPGTLSLLAARLGPVAAIDFSPPMIEKLRDAAARAGVEIDSRVGDGMALPYEDGQFDAAFSMFGLMFFPDRHQGFRELHRVLRPGGRAVVSSWVPMDRVPILAELYSALRAELPDLPLGGGAAPLTSHDDFKAEFGRAGFSGIEIREVTFGMDTPSLREAFESMRRGNAALVLLRQKLGDARWSQVGDALYQRLEAVFGPGPMRIEMTANIAAGSR